MLASDQTLIRVADPATRTGLLTAEGLLAVAAACYDIDLAQVVGEATAVFDRVDLAVTVSTAVSATGRAGRAMDAAPVEASLQVQGLVAPAPGADAVWLGSVVVRTAGPDGVITAVDVTDLGRDARLADDLGLELSLSAPVAVAVDSPPVALPVVVAFLVADVDTSPRALLQQSDAARRAAARYPSAPAPPGAPQRIRESCVCWLVPAAAFDDEGWPGGDAGPADQRRSDRTTAARGWLTGQGIALVTT
ncbi:MAG TPA: hypothetical protein VHW64_13660 [Nocardioides sp.]|uniref:hypothetical protein n=1 Tax=Nocardioides sp. TaxID=35761 RepID=UPI002E374AAB|nr:hypothetical protein [Nocardioides sp.]HEX3931747.1 hypothetical protein [Nocardioides sp.]